jgi:O-antigen/teichoic acid export membrane protein
MTILRKLAHDSAVYGGADFLSKFISFFTFPLIAAALSTTAFGILELVGTSTALVGLAINCGLNSALQRYYWDKDTAESQKPSIVSTGLFLQIFFGVTAIIIGLIVLLIVLPNVWEMILPLTWIGIVAALFLMALRQWIEYILNVLRLHFAAYKFFALSIISRVMGIALAVIAVVILKRGIDGILYVQAGVAFFIFPLALWMIRKDVTTEINKVWARDLVNFGSPLIFASLAYWIFGSMDRWMLAFFSSVDETGVYSVAFRFASIPYFVSLAFAQAWAPHAIKMQSEYPQKYRKMYTDILLILVFVMLIVGGGIALFAGEMIRAIMPIEYSASSLPLAILCFGIIMQSTQQITAIGISLEKKTKILARLAWFAAVINLIFNFLLIPWYGAVGAAYATSISYLALTASYLFYTQRLHPLPIPWGKLLFLIFLGSIIAITSVILIDTPFSLGVVAFKVGISSICVVMGWFFCLSGNHLKLGKTLLN